MIGELLRAEREKQGLTIKDIENETSIRAFYIEAIEQGKKSALPSAVYTKGFIRNYATFLGMDVDAVMQQYREENAEEPPASGEDAVQQATTESSRAPFSSGSDFRARVQSSHRKQHILTAVAVMVLCFIGGIYFFFGEDAQDGKKKNDPAQVATSAVNPAEPASQPTSPSPTAGATAGTAQPVATAQAVHVVASFRARCWVQAVADGNVIFEGTAEPKQSFTWQGKDRITLTAGNAGAIDVVYNGKNMGVLGKDGEVVEKRFTRDKAEDVK